MFSHICTKCFFNYFLTVFSGIYGGHDATEGKFPYIVTLAGRLDDGMDIHLNAGSIINQRWILSCAMCINL